MLIGPPDENQRSSAKHWVMRCALCTRRLHPLDLQRRRTSRWIQTAGGLFGLYRRTFSAMPICLDRDAGYQGIGVAREDRNAGEYNPMAMVDQLRQQDRSILDLQTQVQTTPLFYGPPYNPFYGPPYPGTEVACVSLVARFVCSSQLCGRSALGHVRERHSTSGSHEPRRPCRRKMESAYTHRPNLRIDERGTHASLENTSRASCRRFPGRSRGGFSGGEPTTS